MLDSVTLAIVGAGILLGVVGAVVKLLFVGWAVKKVVDVTPPRERSVPFGGYGDVELQELTRQFETLLRQAAQRPPAQLVPELNAQLSHMQGELSQMDDLRRQRAELRICDIKSQAASMGLFLDD